MERKKPVPTSVPAGGSARRSGWGMKPTTVPAALRDPGDVVAPSRWGCAGGSLPDVPQHDAPLGFERREASGVRHVTPVAVRHRDRG